MQISTLTKNNNLKSNTMANEKCYRQSRQSLLEDLEREIENLPVYYRSKEFKIEMVTLSEVKQILNNMKTPRKMKDKTKEIKAWAIIDNSSGEICTEITGLPMIYLRKNRAMANKYMSLDKVVPCIIIINK